MKKTLIALMALAGAAAATEADTTPITLSATFTSGIAADYPEGSPYVVEIKSLTVGNKSGGSYMTDFLRPELNMNTGNSWTLTFSLTNNSSSAITINSVKFDSFIFNGSGDQHVGDSHTRQAQFTLLQTVSPTSSVSLGSTDVTFCMPESTTGAGDAIWNTDADATITLSSPLEIAARESVQFQLTVGKGNLTNAGSYVGLKGATFTGTTTTTVPEPTTATLSLLALAGLAARRRRK